MSFLRALVAVLLSQIVFALVPVGHTPSGKPFFDAPAGSRVQQSGTSLEVFAPNGSLIHVFENAVPMPNGKKRASTLAGRQGFSATEAFFQIGPSELIQSFNASFVVPPEPKTFESQILFFGPALESLDDTGAPISWFRTALQYGGSSIQGGPFWTASLRVDLPDGRFITISDPSVNTTVLPGQRLSTSFIFDPEGPQIPGFPPFYWHIGAFAHLPDFFTLEIGGQIPPRVATLQMDEEGVSQPSDYPTGSFVFEEVKLNLTTGGFPSISWSTNENPSTGVEVKVEVDGSQDAQVALVFPDTT